MNRLFPAGLVLALLGVSSASAAIQSAEAWWRLQYYFTDPMTSTSDWDGDGSTDLEEFAARTSPTSDEMVPGFFWISLDSGPGEVWLSGQW